MTDQDLDTGTATVNDTDTATATQQAAPEPKASISLDDALKQAFDTHAEKAKSEEAPSPAATTSAETADPGKPVDPLTGKAVEPIKAPASWTPALRERWGTVDPLLQKFIIDREREVAQTLTKTADERKLAGSFKEVAAPYEAMLRQFNVTALDHAKELFNLSHTLNNGSPQTKAEVIYHLINHFKPDAGTLQALFAGRPAPQPTEPPRPVNVAEEVERTLQQRAEREEQAKAEREIEAFGADPKNEFFADVRGLMGKVIDAGLVSGDSLPELFKNAYDLACAQHPEVKQVLATRAAAPAALTAPAAKPVSSVKPSLGAGKSAKAPARSMSIDEAVKAAMAKHGL